MLSLNFTSMQITKIEKDPIYYHREFTHDLGEPLKSPSWLDHGQRIAMAALPLLSQYKPLGFMISSTMGTVRLWTCAAQLIEHLREGKSKEASYDALQTIIATLSLAGSVFAHPVGMIVTTSQDLMIEVSNLITHLQMKDYPKALESCSNIINNSLYLALMTQGGVELGLASLAFQIMIGLYKSQTEVRDGKCMEGAARLLLTCLHCYQLKEQVKILQFKWLLQKQLQKIRSEPIDSKLEDAKEGSIVRQDASAKIPCKTIWPSTLQMAWDQLQLSGEQIQQLQKAIEATYPELGCTGRIVKKGVFSHNGTSFPLPRTIVFLENGEVLISLKDLPLIGKGGERVVKPAYGALSGKMLAKKHVQNDTPEFRIFQHFYKHPELGIVKTVGFYGKNVVQEKYSGNLQQLLSSQSPLSSQAKTNLCYQLLHGLSALHRLPLSSTVKDGLFHNDISTVNILFKEGNQIEVALDDFGQSGKLGIPNGKDWYFAPEVAALKKQLAEGVAYSPEQLKVFNETYGKQRDIWALGLVLADIMKSGAAVRSGDCVGLKCVSNLVKKGAEGIHALSTELKQEQIDREIQAAQNSLPNTPSGQSEKKMWTMINQMLQINPAHRLSSIKDT